MAPFYGWGSTISRLEPLRGGPASYLLFTIMFPEARNSWYSFDRPWKDEKLSQP